VKYYVSDRNIEPGRPWGKPEPPHVLGVPVTRDEDPDWWAVHEDDVEFWRRFVDSPGPHELNDAEVIALIIKFGRAAIYERDDGMRDLTFQSGYD
jgi:hypothetical protein